jgi:hypothetical protein
MAMAQSAGALSAQNPAQALQAGFTRQGMEVRSGQSHWRLELSGYGYGDRLEKVCEAAPQSKGNRVEYQRGPLVEWYVNGPAGLEQGFTLNAPPASSASATPDSGHRTSDSSPVTIALEIGGDLAAMADSPAMGQGDGRAQGLTLRDGYGQAVLRYTGLTAQDATGRALVAWLEVEKEELRLRVEDAGARYPVVVDPFVQQAELTASDGGGQLGLSVAVSSDGTTIVAGAPGSTIGSNSGQGAAYVFVMPEGGWANMTQTATLTASDGASDDGLGASVGVTSDDSTIVVGAVDATIGSNTGQGAAYVFVRPEGGWANMTQNAKLTASDGASSDNLGWSAGVSSDGSTIVAGAWQYGNGGPGAAYVFVRPEGGWANMTQNAKLTASNGGWPDLLGYSVGISGDGGTIVAGARVGYVFVRPGGGWANMTQTATLTASACSTADAVGVSSDGTTIVAGCIYTPPSGAAYVFVRPAAGWSNPTQTAKLTAPEGGFSTEFGSSLGTSTDGSTIVVSNGSGEVYAFVKPEGGWVNMNQTTTLTTPKFYGTSVAVSGDGLSIGVGVFGSNDYQGAAYVFLTAAKVTFTGAPKSASYQGTFTVVSTTNSSSSPVYTSSGACSNSGELYTMTSATGTCTSTVTWAANADYTGATLSQTTKAYKSGQTISFTQSAPSTASYKGTFPVAASSTSGLTVAFSASGVCSLGTPTTVSGVTSATVTMLSGTGTCTIAAKQAGNTDYTAAVEKETSAAALKVGQTISFTKAAPSTASYNSTFAVAADSTSGLKVVFSVDAGSSGVCSLTGYTVKMLSGAGTCTIDANQAGNADYSAAAQQQTSATAKTAAQTISFATNAPASASKNSTFPVAAKSTSGLTVALSVDAVSTGVCSLGTPTVVSGVTSATVTMLKGTGTCTIDANQAGNADYSAAAQRQTSAKATP